VLETLEVSGAAVVKSHVSGFDHRNLPCGALPQA
jgi:hypothetical protein